MNADSLQSIFIRAAALPPAERAAYLNSACAGNTTLRQQVEALLQAHDAALAGLPVVDAPAVPPGPAQPLTGPYVPGTSLETHAEGPGSRIGPYKLLQQIGEGGMGIVYMADQEQPVRRRVAVKIIKPGMDSAQVVARFEAERQALAMMDHQNIARVLDGGATPSGRPYFVMELVHGVPINKFCDDNQLTLRERLELFVPVCQAIQHAHQKAIIHRDIKPSNVLVTLYDDKPVPKVIDFGVAKAVEQRLTERTLFTQFGAMVGTVEYMSPEQAEMNAFGVDTRSDIYSLGVLLYELLTGTTPLERERLRQAALGEAVRLIREEEPPRPSTRLSSSGNLPKLAAARKTDPVRLTTMVRGELDWIVMKCLEKNRTRRYETANALARDVEHHLADEPVEACPPSVVYRLRKFARKHRAGLATAGAFALLLVMATCVSAWLAVAARSAKQEADSRRDQAEEAQRVAKTEGDRATAEKGRAEEAIVQVKANAAETRRALDRVTVMKGIQLAQEGRLFEALPWFVRPLESSDVSPEEETVHRTRLACYLRYTPGRPTLRHTIFPEGPVSHADWTSDAKRILTASNNVVQLWGLSQGKCLANLRHSGVVTNAQFTPDARRILSIADGMFYEWDASTGNQINTFYIGGFDTFPSLDLLQLSTSMWCNLTNAFIRNDARTTSHVYFHHSLLRAAISSNGDFAIIKSYNTLRVVDLKKRVQIHQWSVNDNSGLSDNFAISPVDQIVLFVVNASVYVNDIVTGKLLAILKADLPVNSIAISHDGTRAVTIDQNGVAMIWDLRTYQMQTRLNLGRKYAPRYCHAKISPDNRLVAFCTGYNGGLSNLSLWECKSGRLIADIPDYDRDGVWFEWRADSKQILRSSKTGDVALYEIYNGKSTDPALQKTSLLLPHARAISVALFGPNARSLITATIDGEVRVWDLANDNDHLVVDSKLKPYANKTLTLIRRNKTSHSSFIYHPDTNDIRLLLPPGNAINRGVLSPDQTRIVTYNYMSDRDNYFGPASIQLWNALTKETIGKPINFEKEISSISFSANSKLFVVSGSEGLAYIIDAQTGGRICKPLEHRSNVLFATLSPDGEVAVTCGADHLARIWRTQTGDLISQKLIHNEEVTLAAFSHDGRFIATASLDGIVHIWDRHGNDLGSFHDKRDYDYHGDSWELERHANALYFQSNQLLWIEFANKIRLIDIVSQSDVSPVIDGGIQGFVVPTQGGPVSDLVKLSQLYAGRRLDIKGGYVLLSLEERKTLWRECQALWQVQFSVSSEAVIAWRTAQIKALSKSGQHAWLIHARRWLAIELSESGWDTSLEKNENLSQEDYIERLFAFSVHGRHLEAISAVESLVARRPAEWNNLFNCAYIYLLASKAVKDMVLSDHYSSRAIALLSQAAETGYKEASYIERLSLFAKQDHPNEAVVVADKLAARLPKNNAALYDCACIFALSSNAIKADVILSEKYALRAIALLRLAADAGFDNAAHVRKDTDLDSLRGRDDFKKLLEERFPRTKPK